VFRLPKRRNLEKQRDSRIPFKRETWRIPFPDFLPDQLRGPFTIESRSPTEMRTRPGMLILGETDVYPRYSRGTFAP